MYTVTTIIIKCNREGGGYLRLTFSHALVFYFIADGIFADFYIKYISSKPIFA